MKFSLFPEKPLLLYPSLAATIGLEESILAGVLLEVSKNLPTLINNGFEWAQIDADQLREALPFWNDVDIARISTSLREKGVIIIASAAFGSQSHFKFAFNNNTHSKPNNVSHNQQHQAANSPQSLGPASKNYIAPNWQPDEMTLAQLSQHNIPSGFAYEQVAAFVTYWRESRETARSWGSKFVQHVIYQWRQFETQRNKQEKNAPISSRWQPSEDAMEVMTVHMAIPVNFIEDCIPEFILYWQERGEAIQTWNSKFTSHVRIQWSKYCSAMENNTEPKLIPSNWQPSADVFDILRLANIELNFARSLVPEFVVYWKDSNQVHTSWNTRFLQHAKRQWAHRLSSVESEAAQSTRDISLEQELTDRSWAN